MRFFARRPAAVVPAADHGSGVRLSGVNVEAQIRDRSSLLNWMKRLLQVRGGSQAFGAARCVSSVPATATYWCTCASTALTLSCAWRTCRGPLTGRA